MRIPVAALVRRPVRAGVWAEGGVVSVSLRCARAVGRRVGICGAGRGGSVSYALLSGCGARWCSLGRLTPAIIKAYEGT